MKKTLFPAAILALFMGTSAVHAKTFSLTIINKTDSIVEAVYASPTGESDWEDDLLGDKAIRAGGRYVIRFEDRRGACRYDLRFEFRDSQYEPLEDTQNLCQISEYELSE